MAKPHVSNAEFVSAFVGADSSATVAARLGLKIETVRARACKLRKAGVTLPKYTRGAVAVDVDSLNAIINPPVYL